MRIYENSKYKIASLPIMPRRNGNRTRELSKEALELIAARFRILGEPTRLRLIHALEAGEQSVGELVVESGLNQTNVSRHLQALATAGILGRRKDGSSVYYFIADPTIFDLCHHVCGSLKRRIERHARAIQEGVSS